MQDIPSNNHTPRNTPPGSADPQAWWAGRGRGHHLGPALGRCSTPRSAPTAGGSRAGMLNTCYNCLDRHVAAGRGAQPALIWDSPMTGRVERFTYRRTDATAPRKLAGALAGSGVARGDRVVIYMPMVPEAVIAMLACARLGAIHSVVFGGFAAAELATRIADAQAEGDRFGLVRAGARPGGEIQAAAGRGDRAVAAQAGCLPDPAARRRRRAD